MELTSARMRKPVGVADMVLLEAVTEESILSNLSQRYSKDEIYVSTRRRERRSREGAHGQNKGGEDNGTQRHDREMLLLRQAGMEWKNDAATMSKRERERHTEKEEQTERHNEKMKDGVEMHYNTTAREISREQRRF